MGPRVGDSGSSIWLLLASAIIPAYDSAASAENPISRKAGTQPSRGVTVTSTERPRAAPNACAHVDRRVPLGPLDQVQAGRRSRPGQQVGHRDAHVGGGDHRDRPALVEHRREHTVVAGGASSPSQLLNW